jgi:hypothetical protein
MQFRKSAAQNWTTTQHQNRGAVEAVNKFENLVILELGGIRESNEPSNLFTASTRSPLLGSDVVE